MESNPFYKRFRNRTQFLNKEGVLKLGVFHVSKKAPSKRKVHSDTASLLSASISPSNNKSKQLFPPIIHSQNKSFSFIKYPCICGGTIPNLQDMRNQSFEVPKQGSSSFGYSWKKKLLPLNASFSNEPNTRKNMKRNNSLILRN